ncbi:hypothetical protein SAZ_42285 [Streptomyces noursei ZPM]|uniref:Uncharacterized protein n=1 Tax=Streptomyces noursei TaxID=1971 RepID=A0A401QPR2_STRNR|nr:hypothetical protein [Streptomyces noursei]AKA09290.1 hypothetical protein SAZ_42285 [Streptomyces noursei ZPM]EOS98914.1 hypothetical protein K530_36548 [Streptomyces noursei CCRC 11814]EXU91247.1 hypothetical protein P354_07315 [Streptomyces noursei PD-1]MCZ0974974.1 hypothetical protein [Streptomyces noursei]UWS76865.1 hypothetical protein N1H47_39860 [Streptomyces noursei]
MAGDDEDIRAVFEREGKKILDPLINPGDQWDAEVALGTMTEEQAKKERARAEKERAKEAAESDEPLGTRPRWKDPYNPDASDA